jgi:hypothetical protein
MTDTNNSDVAAQSDAVSKMAEDWTLIVDLMGGTKAMRRAGQRHLPIWPAEDLKSYQARLKTATLFPAYARTVAVLTGKPFGKPITIGEEYSQKLKDLLENIDLEGRNLHAFAADLFANALAYGICGILVDCPPAQGVRTAADEAKLGVRPYFVHVRQDAILGWRSEKRGGRIVLTQLRLMESVEEPDGPFKTKTIQQVRVLEPGKWMTYRKQDSTTGTPWQEHESGVTTIDVIPFIPVYGSRKDFMIGVPPMLELAHLNVEHWQSKSDQQTILHVARVPMLFAKNIGSDTQVVVGAGAMINATAPDSDVKYVEHSGKAIEAGRMSLLDLEDLMRQVGAELLVIKSANTTQVQTISDNEQAVCDLQRITQALENALDQAIRLMARWIKQPEDGNVSIYSDFGVSSLAEASAQLLFEMKVDGSLSHKTLLNEMKRRSIISPDVDIEKEMKVANAEKAQADAAIQRKENDNI